MDYFKESEIIVEIAYFYYKGFKYQGRGILTWSKKQIFHLDIFLDSKPSYSSGEEIGRLGLVRKQDLFSIRMRPQRYFWAIAPGVSLSDKNKLSAMSGKVSFDIEKIIFCDCAGEISPAYFSSGFALYRVARNIDLPDVVSVEKRFGNDLVSHPRRTGGLFYRDDSINLVAHVLDGNYLSVTWKTFKNGGINFSKSDAWYWPIALKNSLSILYGQEINLLQRTLFRNGLEITEINYNNDNLVYLKNLKLFKGRKICKEEIVELTSFFLNRSLSADISQNVFNQLIEASRQKSWYATELLVSTILEASLRTLYHHPLKKTDNSKGLIHKYLKDFTTIYLSGNNYKYRQWRRNCDKAMKIFDRLRNRNAHPDWLIESNGSFSEDELKKSIDDMAFLSCFYGYMILGLAGFENLEPNFPQPLDEQGAIGHISRVAASELVNHPDFKESQALVQKLSEAKTYHQKNVVLKQFRKEPL